MPVVRPSPEAAVRRGPVIVWKQRQRRMFFALTPLIDVMFLLLIFFMLSSQISPYALMPVGGVASANGDAVDTGGSSAPLVIRISHGQAQIGGRDVALADMEATAKTLVGQGIIAFVAIPSASAQVQDVVTALEALQAASASDVTLVSVGAAR